MAINSNHLEKEMKAKGSDHVWSMINELVQQLRGRHQNKKKRTFYNLEQFTSIRLKLLELTGQ